MAKQMLHPGVKWQFRIGTYFSFFIFGAFICFFLISALGPLLALSGFDIGSLLLFVPILIIVFIGLIILVSEIFVQMSYNRWFYEFTPTNLKIERGIIWKRYSNIPYERIQNVDITRGIIARICGFSTLNIQTAGYSAYHGGGGMPHSEGYIPAVDMDEAERIREFVISKIHQHHKSQGL